MYVWFYSSTKKMNGKGVYVGKPQRSHPRSFLKGKTLKSCNRKGRRNNVVVIDLDCDDHDDEVFVDVPEFYRGSGRNGKRKGDKYSFANVICIDDDDKEVYEETIGNNNSGKGRFFRGNSTPVRLSKCKRTYSDKASTSNRYGLGTDTESVSSDDDFAFEGSPGNIKQDWEKAFLRRQNEVFTSVNQAGTSRFCSGSHQDVGTGDKTDRYGGGFDFTNYASHEEVDRSSSVRVDDGKSENIFYDNGCEISSFDRVNSVCNDQSFARDPAGTSHNCIDNQHTGKDMNNNEDGSLVVINDVVNGQSSGEKKNDCVFFNREMHKETDEYRCSVEAELEARQRELQIQAEEARHLKRLRQREKAEAMRLLDMERRQKLRVEEIRRTQKKDEENLNLKEQLRAEVRKQLDRLEAACHDMTSILCGLGITVNGINGVHAAFKRALLTFHPDRSSQSDIRQQVEAEEKFKLVTRMKEKYLSTL